MMRVALRLKRRPRCCGLTLIEVMVTTFVLALVLTTLLAMTSVTLRTTDRRQVEGTLHHRARLAMDEVLLQLRASDLVLPSRSIASLTYSTNGSNIVFSSPGYAPSNTSVFLANVTDYVAFTYDTSDKTLRQTIGVGSGSVRPNRTSFRLADKVSSLTFTYHVREQFKASGSTTFTLSATPLAAPTAFVNGAAAFSSYDAAAKTVTVASASSGADVQILYTISPTANAGAALAFVSQVDVTMVLSNTDGRNITRPFTLNGSARLRNKRT